MKYVEATFLCPFLDPALSRAKRRGLSMLEPAAAYHSLGSPSTVCMLSSPFKSMTLTSALRGLENAHCRNI